MKLDSALKAIAVLGAVGIGMASTAYAQGNGTSGGGQGVSLDGHLHLRDLVDPGTCRWQNGEALLDSMPELQSRLEKIKVLNWYFELMLKREIKSLDFCWTHAEINQSASAMYSNEIGSGTILIYRTPQTVPVGLRVRDAHEVYVQADRFAEFGPQDQALFVIHETLHSFMPRRLDSKTYYEHLFSIVKAIGAIDGVPSETASFEVALRKSDLNVPSSAQYFYDQKFLSYLFESYEGRREMLLSRKITVAELLRKRDFDYLNVLPPLDAAMVEAAKAHLQNELFGEFCIVQDEAVLSELRSQRSERFDVDLFCLTSPGAIDRIMEHPESLENGAVTRLIDRFYNGLAGVTGSIRKDRVVVSKELDWISGNPAIKPRFRYALEVKSPFTALKSDDAETHLLQYARILVAASKVKSPESWLNLVKQGDGFVHAFDFSRLETQMQGLKSPFEGETQASIKNLRAVYRSAMVGIIDRLRAEDSDEYADLLGKLINQSHLGFQVDEE